MLIFYFRTPKSTHDIFAERSMALNHSFHVYFVASKSLPANVRLVNNTHYIHTQLVPNDFADFSRNSYGQQTINDLMHTLGHKHIDILRLSGTASNVQMWELLHFMIYDNLLLNVEQLHISMYIGKYVFNQELNIISCFMIISRHMFSRSIALLILVQMWRK